MAGLHAEIAGGGIAGLALGISLCRQGWSATINEREPEIREVGAGIYLRHNALGVLKFLGVLDKLEPNSLKLERSQWYDGKGRIKQDHYLDGRRRLWMCARETLIRLLEAEAREAGATFRLDTEVTGGTPEGVLHTKDGQSFAGDLIVGADGVGSAVRESLGLTSTHKKLPTIATRYLVPNRDMEPDFRTSMHWSGRRRVGVSACGEEQTYVYMICSEGDDAACALPIDLDVWSRSFPHLRERLQALDGLEPIQHNYALAKCSAWSSGRAAILGDAAHALPPVLGQGAGLALANAVVLASAVGSKTRAEIPQTLHDWEHQYRHYADATQRWSRGLDVITNRWPAPLLPLRNWLLEVLGKSDLLQSRMRVADGFPIPGVAES